MTDIQDIDGTTTIRAVLKENPLGMSIKEIASAIGMSRNSVAKYLEVMAASGHVDVRHVGNAKLYTLSHRVPVGDLFNHTRELIIVIDNDLRVVQASSSFCRFANILREDALYVRLSSLPFPLLSVSDELELVPLLSGGPTWKKEIHVVRNHADVFFEGRFIPTVLEKGIPGITLILEDITERKNALRATRERDRLLQTLFQIPTVPRFFIDRNHKVIYWDRALEILTGIKAEEVVGTSNHWRAFYAAPRICLVDLLIDGKIEAISREYVDVTIPRTGIDDWCECTEYLPEMPAGGRWLHITATRIRDTAGNLTGGMETVEDVTVQNEGHFIIQNR